MWLSGEEQEQEDDAGQVLTLNLVTFSGKNQKVCLDWWIQSHVRSKYWTRTVMAVRKWRQSARRSVPYRSRFHYAIWKRRRVNSYEMVAHLPPHNQNRKRHYSTRSLSPGYGGATGTIVISLRCKRTTTLPMEEAEEAERENEHSLNGERSLNGECRCCVDSPVNMHFPVPKPVLFFTRSVQWQYLPFY